MRAADTHRGKDEYRQRYYREHQAQAMADAVGYLFTNGNNVWTIVHHLALYTGSSTIGPQTPRSLWSFGRQTPKSLWSFGRQTPKAFASSSPRLELATTLGLNSIKFQR